jgi:hypothetical protein
MRTALPQWMCGRDDTVILAREIKSRAADRTIELIPRALFEINWADSGPGLPAGAMAGDGLEGAAIGAVVGATLGLGAGAKEAMDKHDAELAGCLRGKGYNLVSKHEL